MIREAYVHKQTSLLKSRLQTRCLGQHIRYFEHIESTNTEAIAWAESGSPEGALVIAEHQSRGRGRQGRLWESPASQNLLFSLVLRPKISPARFGLITVLASLAVSESISALVSPLSARIKWPNDILLDGKKCCGMLLETSFSADAMQAPPYIIMGIGINVNQELFPGDIAPVATSILLETGRHVDRLQLLSDVLLRLEGYYSTLNEQMIPAYLQQYEEKLAFLNERIELRSHGTTALKPGIIRGISESGALRFETDQGIELLHAGEVTTSKKGV